MSISKRQIHTTINEVVYEKMAKYIKPRRISERLREIGSGRLPLGELIEQRFQRDEKIKLLLQFFLDNIIDEELLVILLVQEYNGELFSKKMY